MLAGPLKVSPKPLKRISPSTFEIVESCRLRVVFAGSPATEGSALPTPSLSLGNVCHSIFEDFNQGKLDGEHGKATYEMLCSIWDERVGEAYQELKSAWGHSVKVPEPSRWPRYQHIKVRFLRYLEGEYNKRESVPTPSTTYSLKIENEKWLRSSDGKIIGRPDRVEIQGNQIELIDLKTGAIDHFDTEDISGKYRRQLLLYAFLWWDTHKIWPSKTSIQSITGDRYSLDVKPEECKTIASQAINALISFNENTSTTNINSLANPAPDSCIYCPYKGGCQPFWEAVSQDWGWYLINILGVVEEAEKSRGVVTLVMRPNKTNLSTPACKIRVLEVPDYDFEPDMQLAVVGAQPTNSTANVRATWNTLYWKWVL
ncbi:PD-(D/E)XK nuclease family protein [Chloroflexota bacterium]